MERRVYIIMKKRKTLIKIVVLSLCLIMLTCTFVSAASTPYSTYTYTMDGETRESPAAYVPDRAITNYDMNMETALKTPKDIFVDPKNYIYIVDTGNNRVVVCNESCTYQFEITKFNNENGVPDQLNGPEGVFVNEEEIFVCDTLNARIVVFDIEGKLIFSERNTQVISMKGQPAGRYQRIVEQTGHGVPEIVKHYGKEAFNITDNHIVVTLKFPFELSKKQTDYQTLNPSQKKVLIAISNQPTITTNELTKVVGLGISRINVLIKELKKLGKIKRIGSNKNGYWEIIK